MLPDGRVSECSAGGLTGCELGKITNLPCATVKRCLGSLELILNFQKLVSQLLGFHLICRGVEF